jgi:hypothetical protein
MSLVFNAEQHLKESPVFKRLPEESKSGSTSSKSRVKGQQFSAGISSPSSIH